MVCRSNIGLKMDETLDETKGKRVVGCRYECIFFFFLDRRKV